MKWWNMNDEYEDEIGWNEGTWLYSPNLTALYSQVDTGGSVELNFIESFENNFIL